MTDKPDTQEMTDISVWYPIEFAPKNGEKVDLWLGNYRIPDCIWDGQKNTWLDDRGEPLYKIADDATHWMPLPQPPMQDGE